MKNTGFRLMVGGLVVASAVAAVARDFEMTLWRGETATARTYDYVVVGEAADVPAGITVKEGRLARVDYVPNRNDTHYASVADRVVWGSTDPGPRVISVSVAPEVKAGTYRFGDLLVTVLDKVLPPASEWKYRLDLWQHPWAVARWYGVEPFSPQHYAKMRPIWKTLADAGQKPLTVTITDLPWNHQCYDAYRSMVRRIKHADGSWTFDYRIFDEYVAFGKSCGLGKTISCYTMCPWDYMVFWEDDRSVTHSVKAVPGTPEFREFWGDFLTDFAAHLKSKGWFDHTYICLDEREFNDVKEVCKFIEAKAPGLKTSLAANRMPSEFTGVVLNDYCSAMSRLTPEFLAEAAGRRAKGMTTTYYVCCGPARPNTFMTSNVEEAFWLGAYPGVIGLDGFLRWAWNSWPQDPYRDATYYGLGDGWPAGDTFLIYPNGEPSIRFLMLRNGIVAAEKLRILKESGEISDSQMAELKKSFDFNDAQGGKYNWNTVRRQVEKAVNGGRSRYGL